ncbi:MAG: ExbD/TolR family protein [Bdellovibrio sp.]|jgi:biopolymer transport protein TolR
MRKDLNFEINILPILDILSVLICFLLLTAVWVQIGSIDTKQAIGDNSTSSAKNPPSLWIGVAPNGTVKFSLRDVGTKMQLEAVIASSKSGINWETLNQKIQSLKTQLPDLKTVVIRPEAKANYGDVIKLMDQLKQNQMTDIGLSPLG